MRLGAVASMLMCDDYKNLMLHVSRKVKPCMLKSMSSHLSNTRVHVKLIRPEAKMPFRADCLSAGADLFSAVDTVVQPRDRKVVHTGISVEIMPKEAAKHFYLRIAPRSGLAVKGVDVGAGVVDTSYRGELGVVMINNTDKAVRVNAGDRVAQVILERIEIPEFVCTTDDLSQTTRGTGGFGSTGI